MLTCVYHTKYQINTIPTAFKRLKMGLFMWRKSIAVLLLAICTYILLDIAKHNSFKASRTGEFFRKHEILQHLKEAPMTLRKYCQQFYWWTKHNGPVYIARARKAIVPAVIVVKDALTSLVSKIWINIKLLYKNASDKTPFLVQWVNSISPGLGDTALYWATQIGLVVAEYTQMLMLILIKSMQTLKDAISYVYTSHVYMVL